MYEIYLTVQPEDSAHPERAADLLTVDGAAEAHELCATLQGYLREGVEAHFESAP
ncbi:MAG TPA: hypothetical protein VIZ43_10890 [Trebonia sp.]